MIKELKRLLRKNMFLYIFLLLLTSAFSFVFVLLDNPGKEDGYAGPISGMYNTYISSYDLSYNAYLKNGLSFDKYTDLFNSLSTYDKWEYVTQTSFPIKTDDDVFFSDNLLVTNNFFSHYGITAENFDFNTGFSSSYAEKTYSIVLGSDYKSMYSVGDEFTTFDFLTDEETTFTIVAFVDKDCYYTDPYSKEKISCDNYSFIPILGELANNRDCRDLLEKSFSGFIFSEKSFFEVEKEIRFLENEVGIGSLKVVDTDNTYRYQEWSKRYERMSDEVYDYINKVTWILSICLALIIGFLLTSILYKESYTWGIYLMCGRSISDIQKILLSFVLSLCLICDLVSIIVICLSKGSLLCIAKLQFMYLVIVAISYLACHRVLKINSLSLLIGGKE